MQAIPADDPALDWNARIHRAQGPIYLAIADAIAAAIAAGELTPGDRLPPHRRLAAKLGVDLTTVSRAYAESRRRGLLDATVGRGTFVRTQAPHEEGAADMSMNLPPQPPALRGMLADGLAGLLRRADLATLMTYRPGAGTGPERAAAADWLRPVLGEVDPGRVLVCAGAQVALAALLTLLAKPGDVVLTEPLTYPGLRALAAHLGISLQDVAADGDGMLPEALDRACRERRPNAVYCIPTIHNPTTVTTPPARRQALAEVARRHQVAIIEDDAYGLLPDQPLAAIATLAPAYYIATLSKCLSPGLRTAFAVAPDVDAAAPLAVALRAVSQMPAPVMTGLATGWIRDGSAAALRAAIRDEAAARQRIARELLPAGGIEAHPRGLHLWLRLPARWNRLDFASHVRRQGLALVPADAFLVARQAPNAVRISLGAADSQAALRAALQAVAQALRGPAPNDPGAVV